MSREKKYAGTTSNMLTIFVQSTASTTGGGLAGLTHSTSGLVAEYRRRGQSSWTSITLVSKTLGTYTSGGFVADGSLDGAYEFDPPDAAFAAGSEWVAIRLRGAANMLPVLLIFELDAVNYQDATAFGLSRIDAAVSSRMATYTQPTGFLAATFPTTVASPTNITSATGVVLAATTHTGAVIPTVTNLTNGVTVSDKTGFSLASNGLASVTSWTVNITGNLSGSVGSVTGNVGGNVTGSVGSISGVTFPMNFGLLGINGSGHVSRVVLVDTTTTNTDMRGTDGAALATHWTSTRAGYLDGVLIAANYNQRTVQVTGSNHVASDVHQLQPAVIDATAIAPNAIGASQLAADAVTEIGVGVWVSAGYAAAIRSAIGMAAADLDTQLDSLAAAIDPGAVWTDPAAATTIRAAMGLATNNLDSQLAAALVLQKLAASGATGSVQVTDNGNGTATLVFKDTNGSTTLATVTYNYTSGARTRVS